jgi:hypothetical protein
MRGVRSIALPAVIAVVFGWQSGAAMATTYCVATPPGCSGTAEATLTAAITAANADSAGSDTIVLPAGTQTGPSGGYLYSGTTPLAIDGQGASATTVTLPMSASAYVLDATVTSALTLQSLGVAIPAGAGFGGVFASLGTAVQTDNVDVTDASNSDVFGMVLEDGGTVSHTSIDTLAGGGTAINVADSTLPTTIQDSTLSGEYGLEVSEATGLTVVHRCSITAFLTSGTPSETNTIALEDLGSMVYIDDSLLSSQGSGIDVSTTASPASVVGSQLTITGTGTSTGVFVDALGAGVPLASLTDSIIADPIGKSFDLARASSGDGPPQVSTDYSDYDHATVTTAAGVNFTPGPQDTTAYEDPKFAHPLTGDFRLLASSPLIGLDPTLIGGGPLGSQESATDINGLPRITGSGRDLGAYQHQPPAVTATASPASVAPGVPVTFTGTGSTVTPSDPLSFSWSFDDGAIETGLDTTQSFSANGLHSGTLTATDALGFTSTATADVTVSSPAPSPRVSDLAESAKVWREGNRIVQFSSAPKHPLGTTFTFTLNTAATVKLSFTRSVDGRRLRGKCLARTAHNRHKPACLRSLAAGSLTFSGDAGANRVLFQGRLSNSDKLPLGVYAMTLTAIASGHSSVSQLLHFTIVAR